MMMKKYLVETQATVKRHYEIMAHSIEDALKDATNQTPTFEEEIEEETLSVSPIKE